MTWGTVVNKTSLIVCSLLVDVLENTHINMFYSRKRSDKITYYFCSGISIHSKAVLNRAVLTTICHNKGVGSVTGLILYS